MTSFESNSHNLTKLQVHIFFELVRIKPQNSSHNTQEMVDVYKLVHLHIVYNNKRLKKVQMFSNKGLVSHETAINDILGSLKKRMRENKTKIIF